jgi:hypothetical protein
LHNEWLRDLYSSQNIVWHLQVREDMCTGLRWGSLKERRGHLEDIGVDCSIILKWMV